jgi:endo-1,3(4)-beta-glucanase
VYAIAAIAKRDQEFLNKYSEEINIYVRDYANPSHNDPYFTFTRCKDWFTWHSWAAGLYEFADNRNQESTSEAINGYYAVSLLGKVLENKELDDFGRFLTATEVISTKAYWQMPSYNPVYPEQFRKNLMVGILWSTKVDYTTFFGGKAEFIHGIQFLPFTPMTEEYLDSRFMTVSIKID